MWALPARELSLPGGSSTSLLRDGFSSSSSFMRGSERTSNRYEQDGSEQEAHAERNVGQAVRGILEVALLDVDDRECLRV